MSEGIYKVVDAINAIGAAARAATSDIQAAVNASSGRTGDDGLGPVSDGSTSGRTGGAPSDGNRGATGELIDALKGLGGRT